MEQQKSRDKDSNSFKKPISPNKANGDDSRASHLSHGHSSAHGPSSTPRLSISESSTLPRSGLFSSGLPNPKPSHSTHSQLSHSSSLSSQRSDSGSVSFGHTNSKSNTSGPINPRESSFVQLTSNPNEKDSEHSKSGDFNSKSNTVCSSPLQQHHSSSSQFESPNTKAFSFGFSHAKPPGLESSNPESEKSSFDSAKLVASYSSKSTSNFGIMNSGTSSFPFKSKHYHSGSSSPEFFKSKSPKSKSKLPQFSHSKLCSSTFDSSPNSGHSSSGTSNSGSFNSHSTSHGSHSTSTLSNPKSSISSRKYFSSSVSNSNPFTTSSSRVNRSSSESSNSGLSDLGSTVSKSFNSQHSNCNKTGDFRGNGSRLANGLGTQAPKRAKPDLEALMEEISSDDDSSDPTSPEHNERPISEPSILSPIHARNLSSGKVADSRDNESHSANGSETQSSRSPSPPAKRNKANDELWALATSEESSAPTTPDHHPQLIWNTHNRPAPIVSREEYRRSSSISNDRSWMMTAHRNNLEDSAQSLRPFGAPEKPQNPSTFASNHRKEPDPFLQSSRPTAAVVVSQKPGMRSEGHSEKAAHKPAQLARMPEQKVQAPKSDFVPPQISIPGLGNLDEFRQLKKQGTCRYWKAITVKRMYPLTKCRMPRLRNKQVEIPLEREVAVKGDWPNPMWSKRQIYLFSKVRGWVYQSYSLSNTDSQDPHKFWGTESYSALYEEDDKYVEEIARGAFVILRESETRHINPDWHDDFRVVWGVVKGKRPLLYFYRNGFYATDFERQYKLNQTVYMDGIYPPLNAWWSGFSFQRHRSISKPDRHYPNDELPEEMMSDAYMWPCIESPREVITLSPHRGTTLTHRCRACKRWTRETFHWFQHDCDPRRYVDISNPCGHCQNRANDYYWLPYDNPPGAVHDVLSVNPQCNHRTDFGAEIECKWPFLEWVASELDEYVIDEPLYHISDNVPRDEQINTALVEKSAEERENERIHGLSKWEKEIQRIVNTFATKKFPDLRTLSKFFHFNISMVFHDVMLTPKKMFALQKSKTSRMPDLTPEIETWTDEQFNLHVRDMIKLGPADRSYAKALKNKDFVRPLAKLIEAARMKAKLMRIEPESFQNTEKTVAKKSKRTRTHRKKKSKLEKPYDRPEKPTRRRFDSPLPWHKDYKEKQ